MSRFGITKHPADVLKAIALKHRNLRKAQGYSQSELARRSGVSYGSIKRFETTGQIALESLLKLALLLDRLEDFDPVFKEDENLKEIEKLFSDKTRANGKRK